MASVESAARTAIKVLRDAIEDRRASAAKSAGAEGRALASSIPVRHAETAIKVLETALRASDESVAEPSDAELLEDVQSAIRAGESGGGITVTASAREFVVSVGRQLAAGRRLSEKQRVWLKDLWDRI